MRIPPAAVILTLVCTAADGLAAASPAPPRYTTSGPMKRASTGALLRDDFDSKVIDETLWRIWHSDPQRVRLEQKDGRFWIHAHGKIGYNGLASRTELPTRDVVATCRMGVTSSEGALHAGLLHVCGSGSFSPDHWFELNLRATPRGTAQATIAAAVPPEMGGGYRGMYDLPPASPDGYLSRVVCDGATNQCRGFVRVGLEWWQIGDAVEVPARTTHLEIKTSGPDTGAASTTIWFDDCRLYPRPETHYIGVILQGLDGRPPGEAAGASGDAACLDGENKLIAGCGFSIKLYTADGTTLVAETTTGTAFGYGTLKLNQAPWDDYPAAAIIRVFANDRQLGPDHVIEAHGVDGLYPDDVYTIGLR